MQKQRREDLDHSEQMERDKRESIQEQQEEDQRESERLERQKEKENG
jgi:hypothetical protein